MTMEGNPGRALLRKIAGGSFFLESVSTGVAGVSILSCEISTPACESSLIPNFRHRCLAACPIGRCHD